MRRIKQPIALSKTLSISLVVILLSIAISQAHAEKPAIMSEGVSKVILVEIDNKVAKYSFIFVGERRFRVSSTTTILDHSRKRITLELLPIPCRAKITYRLFGDNRDPMVEKIQLK